MATGRFSRLATAAVFDTRLDCGPLRVLAALATYADENGHCYPAVSTIANRLHLSRRTVQRHMRDLEALGYLVRHFQYRIKGGGNASNSYTLQYPEISADSSLPPNGGYDPSAKEANRASEAPKANANGATPSVTASDENRNASVTLAPHGATPSVTPPATSSVTPGATPSVTLTIPLESIPSERIPNAAAQLFESSFKKDGKKESPTLASNSSEAVKDVSKGVEDDSSTADQAAAIIREQQINRAHRHLLSKLGRHVWSQAQSDEPDLYQAAIETEIDGGDGAQLILAMMPQQQEAARA